MSFSIVNNKEYLIVEYKTERKKLHDQGIKPTGINKHLQSFISYLEWKEKTEQLFGDCDKAKDLL